MYYFEILQLLKEEGREMSTSEIFFALSSRSQVNALNMKRALLKLYLKNDAVDRQWRVLTSSDGKTWREYVYFISD
jgi:hypothetical protein